MRNWNKILNWTGLVCTVTLAGACITMSANDHVRHGEFGSDDVQGNGVTVGGGGGLSTSASTSASGGPQDEPELKPEEPEDVSCETLDQSQALTLYLSADDSNSMASPVRIRQQLKSGSYPSGAIRTYEYLNYYNIDYPEVSSGIGVFPQLQKLTDEASEGREFEFQIGVRSAPLAERRAVNLTLVLDTSGSMGGDPIAREKDVIRSLAKALQEGDIVSAVTWSETQKVDLDGHVVTGPNDPALLNLAQALKAGGGTDLNAGLVRGYELANKNFDAERLNRLVLISDGGANAGITDQDLIAKESEKNDQEGIYLVGVGTGHDNGASYYDELMDTVTDKGRGAYVYIDSSQEADHMFVERFDEVMEVAARAVQVKLQLPWYFQMAKFHGEEFSQDPEEIEPQHLAPNDTMVFNQVLRACSPEVVDLSDTITVEVNYQVPGTLQTKKVVVSKTVGQLLDGSVSELLKGRAIVAVAEALKQQTQQSHDAAIEAIDQAGGGKDGMLLDLLDQLKMHPSFKHL